MAAITLPENYSYVLAAVSSTFFVNLYHSSLTGKYRRLSGQKYPISFASNELAAKDPAAFKFNCAQRAHHNFTENLVPAIGSILITGLRAPLLAASLGGIWSVSRVLYAWGYCSDAGPNGRYRGGITGGLSYYLLILLSAYSSVMLVLGK
ncbi:membrane-associated proteins in eicosanoid and glutathione metabolism [Thozetella sp. PMI_491]|nr:membrane-associated proteins in eicosanoid and glutathione metabolism [Thozetella sp. PMI_491]